MSLNELLIERKWTPKELAVRIGVSQSAVSYWLSGENRISNLNADKIAEVLDCRWFWICEQVSFEEYPKGKGNGYSENH